MNANQLDRLFQQLSRGRQCSCCGRPAECVHHYVGRTSLLLRWDVANAVPVCLECHRKIHDGKIKPVLTAAALNWCETYRHTLLKDWLLAHQVTEQEFLADKEREIMGNLL